MAYDTDVGYDELGYDELGEDEDVGEDLFEDVGAAPRRGPVRRPQGGQPFTQPRRGQPAQGNVVRKPMTSNQWLGVVGYAGTSIAAAAAAAAFTVAVTCNFTLRQILLDRVQAASLTIGDIKVGQTTVFGSSTANPAPGDMFAPDSLVNPVFRNLPLITPTLGFQIWIGNAGAGAIVPRIGFIGVCSQA